MKGVDFAYGWRPGLGAAIAASLVDGEHPAYVGRYLTYPGDGDPPAGVPPKGIFDVERKDYHAAGLAVLFFFEVGSGEWREGFGRGQTHGVLAMEALLGLGAPDTTVAFFAIDTDTNPADYAALRGYLQGAAKVMGWGSAGVYGEADVVDFAFQNGLVSHAVQCEAWSGGRLSEHADYYQHARYHYVNGVQMDIQTSRTLAGTWEPEDDMAKIDELNAAIVKREDIRRVASGTDEKGYDAMLRAWDLLKKEGIIP